MFKTSFFYTAEKLLPRTMSIVLLPILLRLIKPELWAEITLLLAIQFFISIFLTQGDENSILKFTVDEELMSRSLTTVLKSGIIIFCILEIVGQIVNYFPFSIEYGLPFRFMFFATVLLSVNKLFVAKLKSLEKASKIFKSSLFESIFINIGQIILIATTVQIEGGFNTRVIVTAYFMIQFLGYFLKFLYLRKVLNFSFKNLIKNLFSKKPKDFLIFSILSFAMLLTSYFLNWQDRFFVEFLFDLRELGIYSVALKIATFGAVFIYAITTSAYAKYWPRGENTKLKKSVVKVTNELLIISSTAFISIGLISTSIGKYIVPESYWEALSLIFLSTITLFLQTVVYIFTVDYGKRNLIQKVVFFNVATFLLQIILYFSFELTDLSDVFYIRIITSIISTVVIFFDNFKKHLKVLLTNFFLIMITSYLSYLFLTNNSQFLQIILFLIGLISLAICLFKWFKIDMRNLEEYTKT